MRPHQDTAPKPADISAIIKLALDYNPNLATADLSTPRMWVNEGCDIDRDIIPTMSEIIKKKRGVSTFSYFTNPVLAARDSRIAKGSLAAPPIEAIMQSRAWKRSRGLTMPESDLKALLEYEALHGNIMVAPK